MEKAEEFTVSAGQVGFDPPSDRAHRAVNVGRQRYDEVVTFFLDHEGQDPQPRSCAVPLPTLDGGMR